MMRRSFRWILPLLALLIGLPVESFAVCNQTTVSKADSDLWAIHGCFKAFFLWQYKQYNMSSNDWGNRGWNDACNDNLEYPKTWNAAYLVTYGLLDNNNQSFHGTTDYRQLAEAPDSNFKDSVYYDATDATNIFGSFTYHWPGDDEITLSCNLFSASVPNANPGSRAGDFMHEGWHGWLTEGNWDNGSAGGHRPCTKHPDGTCTNGACTINGCDYFYFHGIGAYAFGALYQTDGTAKRFHSPNQVQVEFLCDVSDQPQQWVPASVRQAAAVDANQRAAQRFINGPGYTCGSPRPW
jgi:hypothetical protein